MNALYKDTLSKSGFRFVEKLLYDMKKHDTAIAGLEKELSDVLETIAEMYTLKAMVIDDMPRGGGTSCPTESMGIKRADNPQTKYLRSRIDEMHRHKKAIAEALSYMTETEKLLIKLKYDRERSSRECMKEMHIEKSRWYEMRQELIYKIANYLGVY